MIRSRPLGFSFVWGPIEAHVVAQCTYDVKPVCRSRSMHELRLGGLLRLMLLPNGFIARCRLASFFSMARLHGFKVFFVASDFSGFKVALSVVARRNNRKKKDHAVRIGFLAMHSMCLRNK